MEYQKPKCSGIYKIQSKTKPDRVYIGSAIKIDKRWNIHLHHLRYNKHGNKRLQNHYNKYGEEDLVFSLLLECDKDELLMREQEFIDLYHPFFNICQKAGSPQGRVVSEETKEKIRNFLRGRKQSEETIRRRMESMGAIWNKGLTKEDPRVARSVRNFHGVKKELRTKK